MNAPFRALVAAMAFTAVPHLCAAQDAAPPRNPIFLSITGTNGEPVIFRDVDLSSYNLLTGSVGFEKSDTSAKGDLCAVQAERGVHSGPL